MAGAPETSFVRAGDVDIAYQVFGRGPIDLVWMPGWISHIEVMWECPAFARFLERLGSFSRVITFDKRGVGLSDRVPGVATLEDRMEDVIAVTGAVGSTRAALVGWFEGASTLAVFAATHPDRVSSLVLGAVTPRLLRDDRNPWGVAPEVVTTLQERIRSGGWGQGIMLPMLAPSMAADPLFVAWWRRYERMAATPRTAAAIYGMNAELDVGPVLPLVQAPTLVLHRTEMRFVDLRAARWFADQIPGARFVELPGRDIFPYVGDSDRILDEIEEFVTGAPASARHQRVLTTVLFTDIVGSTDRLAEVGDRRWSELLDAHHAEVRGQLARYGGREVDTAGDGFLATFDGPARAVRAAVAIVEGVQRIGLEVRAGLHTGEVEARDGHITGLAVHIGARIGALARGNEVLVSSTVKDLVAGSGLAFADRGRHALRGVPDEWQVYAVEPSR